MSLRSPWMLVWLAAVPALVLAYVWMVRLRAERAARLASEGLVPTAPERRVRWRRHVPFALFAAAVGLICFSLARPTVSFGLPEREGTVILAFDVSNSMRADDVEPTRLDAAKLAATTFIEKQPNSIRIGVVAFGDSAITTLRPTSVKPDAIAAVKRLSVGGGTSLAQGLYTSLSAIAGKPLKIDRAALEDENAKVNIGYFGSSAIVVFSDGENTSNQDPVRMAEVASSAGVKIDTIGVGTRDGTVLEIDGFSVATALDEEVLQQIAKTTDGTYQRAEDADALADISKSIPLKLETRKKPREVTALFAAGAGLLLALGSLLSIAWFGRVV